jgi:hypothetical protein
VSEMDIHDDVAVETEDEETDLEAPEADAAEQHQPVRPGDDDQQIQPRPFDVDEYDAAEQRRVVELDEEDYR